MSANTNKIVDEAEYYERQSERLRTILSDPGIPDYDLKVTGPILLGRLIKWAVTNEHEQMYALIRCMHKFGLSYKELVVLTNPHPHTTNDEYMKVLIKWNNISIVAQQ